ncbi:MAG: hypothetical protein ACI9UT_000054 [Flavobacteriales bacterium]|jgi:hypothetical protein
MLYANLKNQYFILVKKATLISYLLGIFTKALSRINNNKRQIKPAKLGIL